MASPHPSLLSPASNFKGVLFDLDGTLIDSALGLARAANSMLAKRKIAKKPLSAYRPYCGLGTAEILKVAFGSEIPEDQLPLLREEYFAYYESLMTQKIEIFNGIDDIIKTLNHQQISWGIVTNKLARFTVPLVNSIELFSSAKAIVSGDSTPYGKPHPAPLLEAALQLKIAANHCIYVGDGERDVQAAKAAQMCSIAVSYGYIDDVTHAQKWASDFLVNNTKELKTLLLG